MSRRKNQQSSVSDIDFSGPEPLSRDELGTMSLAELEEIHRRLELERSVVVDNSAVDPRPWEVELAYVERAMDDRRRYELITPRALWN